jgi:hypothetical protein
VELAAGFQVPIKPVVFVNIHTNKCLQPLNGSTAQGAAIIQTGCNSSNKAQQWLPQVGGHFQNVLSGLCLDARGKAKNGTPVQQWTCDQISNENWDAEVGPPGIGAPVKSQVSGSNRYCLDVPGGKATDQLPMQIYGCNGSVAQIWLLNPIGSSPLAVPGPK